MIPGKGKEFLRSLLLILYLSGCIFYAERAWGGSGFEQDRDFVTIKAASFAVHYESTVSLERVYRRLNRRRLYFNPVVKPDPLSGPEEKITHRLNIILERVRQVLGMYPENVYFHLRIFKNQEAVTDTYHKISRKNERVKAFYVHGVRTIYASEENISDSVLAHEIAHVLEHYYFAIPPSDKIAEVLAVYVDGNLEE